MVIFDQLRISDNGKYLYINAHVNKASYFNNIYIKKVTILTADQVSETDPTVPTSNYIYQYTVAEKQKEINLVLDSSDFQKVWEEDPKAAMFKQEDISNTLFFVYIECYGIPGICTPCRLDELTTLGVVFDENILYQRVMDYTKELTDDCCVHTGFTDFILLWYAFKAAIETEHYIAAIKFYNMLFGDLNNNYIKYTGGCGCHG